MNSDAKTRRAPLLRRQVEIEENECKRCPKRPGELQSLSGCALCPFGKELVGIGIQLDRIIQDSKAGTHTPTISKVTPEMVRLALSRGIPADTLKHRVYALGWDTMRAVSQPVKKRRKKAGR